MLITKLVLKHIHNFLSEKGVTESQIALWVEMPVYEDISLWFLLAVTQWGAALICFQNVFSSNMFW